MDRHRDEICEVRRGYRQGAFPKLKTAVLTKAGDTEAIFTGVYDDRATAEHVSSDVAAPWFAENIRPYLAGPANRSAGEVIAGFTRG